ncbi:uncharacterized protein [Clytia hemisphaerica]|uniref:uncharacterized protein n=1 Tax=Clytia hemisphaerica TaxID=252671 RepID=UPI0034D573BC|eukprot:TCONS_00056292-protein
MMKHSYPMINSVKKNERHPTNSESIIHIFVGYRDTSRCSRRKILKNQLEERCGESKITMQLTKCIKTCDKIVPYKCYTRKTLSFAEFSSLHPDGIIYDPEIEIDLCTPDSLGAYILHKKAIWRQSYVSIDDATVSNDKVSDKVCCFIERIDHEDSNTQVHEQANFLIETFKAHPVSGKYLQGLIVYKNTQTDYERNHFPDLIIEFSIMPKSGKYFSALLKDFCKECTAARVYFGVYGRKQIVSSPKWV